MIESSGDPARPVKLKVDIVKPLGSGPFPLVIYNHGSKNSKKPDISSAATSLRYSMGVYYFLSRGYAVALPQLRGFSGSGGALPNTGCNLDALARANAKDILATLEPVTKTPGLDATRIIVAGESLGGWNTLAVGALGDPRVKALVSFYGGARSSACATGDRALIQGAQTLGRTTHIPSLWLYGDNDRFFGRPLWQAMHRAYTAAGGRAELIGYGKFGSDSHTLLGQPYAITVFASKLDAFLTRSGFSATVSHPEFVPMTPPPASGFASLDDVDAVPFMNEAKRQAYRVFLKKPNPKAFLIATGKFATWSAEGFDPLASALENCRRNGVVCRPYAFNNDVVWTYPNPQPPATGFARLDDVAAVPFLDEAGRRGYRAFLALEKPRAFVIAPNGRWSASAGTLDPTGDALAQCKRQQQECRPYAVDRQVVWAAEGGAAPR